METKKPSPDRDVAKISSDGRGSRADVGALDLTGTGSGQAHQRHCSGHPKTQGDNPQN